MVCLKYHDILVYSLPLLRRMWHFCWNPSADLAYLNKTVYMRYADCRGLVVWSLRHKVLTQVIMGCLKWDQARAPDVRLQQPPKGGSKSKQLNWYCHHTVIYSITGILPSFNEQVSLIVCRSVSAMLETSSMAGVHNAASNLELEL